MTGSTTEVLGKPDRTATKKNDKDDVCDSGKESGSSEGGDVERLSDEAIGELDTAGQKPKSVSWMELLLTSLIHREKIRTVKNTVQRVKGRCILEKIQSEQATSKKLNAEKNWQPLAHRDQGVSDRE